MVLVLLLVNALSWGLLCVVHELRTLAAQVERVTGFAIGTNEPVAQHEWIEHLCAFTALVVVGVKCGWCLLCLLCLWCRYWCRYWCRVCWRSRVDNCTDSLHLACDCLAMCFDFCCCVAKSCQKVGDLLFAGLDSGEGFVDCDVGGLAVVFAFIDLVSDFVKCFADFDHVHAVIVGVGRCVVFHFNFSDNGLFLFLFLFGIGIGIEFAALRWWECCLVLGNTVVHELASMHIPDFALLLFGLLLLCCSHAANHGAMFLGAQEMGPYFVMNL